MTLQTHSHTQDDASRESTLRWQSSDDSIPAAERGAFDFDLALRHSGTRRVELRWERVGDPRLPTVFVAGGISAHRHVAASRLDPEPGWWDSQVGAGRAIDPRETCVVSFDWIGADGALDVVIDPVDQVDAVAALLDRLGIGVLSAFVGCSYGAMVGLCFAVRHGARLARLVAISGTHRAHPYASAWRALQRRAIALGALQCDEVQGVVLARQLALLSYRSPEEFAARFDGASVQQGRVRVGAEDYLDHCGAEFARRFSAVAYGRLSESIDLQALDPAEVRVAVDVVAVAEDALVPLADAQALFEALGDPRRLRVIHSRYGHDAFLKEHAAIADVLRDALRAQPRVRA